MSATWPLDFFAFGLPLAIIVGSLVGIAVLRQNRDAGGGR